MAFSGAILKAGVSFPLHPFIDEVLQFFDVVSFQLTPNSYCIIVAFYIAFIDSYGFKSSVSHFAYVFGIKALTKHTGFLYTTGRGDAIGIGVTPINIGQWKNDFFVYPSARSREVRVVHKWQPALRFPLFL